MLTRALRTVAATTTALFVDDRRFALSIAAILAAAALLLPRLPLPPLLRAPLLALALAALLVRTCVGAARQDKGSRP